MSDPYDKGFDAFDEGVSSQDNPYPPNSEDAKEWNNGWDEGDRECEDAEEPGDWD